MTRARVKLAAIVLCSLWLIGRGVLHWSGSDDPAKNAKSFDLVGMLGQISESNAQLGKTNLAIVDKMERIDEQTGKTGQVSEKLREVNGGLVSQNDTLKELVPVTADQVTLSTSLKKVSLEIKGSMKMIQMTSEAQTRELQKLNEVVSKANRQVKEAADGNDRLHSELEKAEAKSRQIEQAIP